LYIFCCIIRNRIVGDILKEIKLNVDGIDFVVEEHSGNYSYYKIINGVKVIPSLVELQKLLEELSKMNKVTYSVEEIKELIQEKIKNGEIKTSEDLNVFLSSFELTDDLEELKNFGNELLALNNLQMTPVEEFAEFLKGEYNKALYSDSYFEINFNLKGAGPNDKYFEVTLVTEKDGKKYSYDKSYYLKFNEETTMKLINPIILETASKGVVYNDYLKRPDELINNRYNYSICSEKKCNVNINNIEQYYAEYIKKKAMEAQLNPENRNVLNENYDNLTESQLQEVYTWEQLQEMKDLGYKPSEYEKWRENNLKLTREKPDNKGFVNLLIIATSEFLAVLFILFQILLSK